MMCSISIGIGISRLVISKISNVVILRFMMLLNRCMVSVSVWENLLSI